METELALSPELEEQIRNHKVVAFPNQRLHYRTTVRELAALNNNKASQQQKTIQSNHSQSSPPQRARSLSAGRSRYRPANDLISEIHERINSGMVRKTYAGPGGEEPGVSSNNTSMAGTAQSPSFLSQDPSSNNANSVVSGSHESDHFQARYRNVLIPRGRGLDRPMASAEQPPAEAPELRRTRSLSRGRRSQLARRWPPVNTNLNKQHSPPQVAQPQYPAHKQQQDEEIDNAAASITAMTVNHSNSQTMSPKRPTMTTPPKRGSSVHTQGNNVQRNYHQHHHQVEHSPSWNENSSNTPSGFGEEKKEDYAELQIQGAPSIKDRISVYGKTGSVSRGSKTPTGLKRTIDPTYAAQFAVRDHPPKIDIYEGKRADSDVMGGSSGSGIDLPIFEPVVYTTNSNPEEEQQQQQVLLSSPRNPTKSEISLSSRSIRGGNLANMFLAAINKKQPTSSWSQQQQVPQSSAFRSPTNGSTTCAPLAEIAVADSGDSNGNDGNSVTGLSTMSGEEFSAHQKKPGWTDRSRVSAFRPTTVPPSKTSSSGPAVGGTSNHAFALGSDMERLVEERVQARVADVEARIEQKLRVLVNHMEDKIMQRLDALESKMMAAVSKRK